MPAVPWVRKAQGQWSRMGVVRDVLALEPSKTCFFLQWVADFLEMDADVGIGGLEWLGWL